MARLDPAVGFVHVFDARSEAHAFGPDDEVPDWAAAKMGAHVFPDGEHPLPDSDYPGKAAAADGPDRQPGQEPPRSGAGASRDAWAEFAREKGQEVAPEAKRPDIISALEAEGIIAEKS